MTTSSHIYGPKTSKYLQLSSSKQKCINESFLSSTNILLASVSMFTFVLNFISLFINYKYTKYIAIYIYIFICTGILYIQVRHLIATEYFKNFYNSNTEWKILSYIFTYVNFIYLYDNW